MIIKSVSGIRGIIGEGLDPFVVLHFAAHFGEFLQGKSVMVGRDSRKSGEALKNAALAGLMGVGVDVIDLGVVPTPTLLYNVKTSNVSGGIVITASHNPAEWNALKLVSEDGEFLSLGEVKEFFSLEGKLINWKSTSELGKSKKKSGGIERHMKGVFRSDFINISAIKKRKFRIAIDCVNGGASVAYPKFLKRLNANVYPIFCDGNGEFPRDPEPKEDNLSLLEEKVRELGADIGFATDPDGDRLAIVSERGVALSEESTIVLAIEAVLSKKKGPVVINLSTTRSAEDITKRAGVPLYRSLVGEANVVSLMKEKNAIIGGEGNGGVIFPEIQYTRDAMVAMGLILQYLVERDEPLSYIINTIPQYKIIKETLRMDNKEEQVGFVERVKKANKGKKIDHRDGVRIEEDDRWVHVRMSGTEPVIRIIAEAPTKKGAISLYEMVKEQGRY